MPRDADMLEEGTPEQQWGWDKGHKRGRNTLRERAEKGLNLLHHHALEQLLAR